MAFVRTLAATEADEEVRRMYERQAGFFGYLPNYATVFSGRPEIMSLWAHLQAGIKSNMSPRLFELVTLAAAHELRSSYCCLAHGRKLMTSFSPQEVRAIVVRDGEGVLSPAEVAAVRHARLVARAADEVSAADVERLREAGYSDDDIFDITATAAARAFFTKLVDGLGAEPDAVYGDMDADMLDSLMVGRPIQN